MCYYKAPSIWWNSISRKLKAKIFPFCVQAYVRFGDTVSGTLNALLTDGLDSHSWFYYEDEGVGFETF